MILFQCVEHRGVVVNASLTDDGGYRTPVLYTHHKTKSLCRPLFAMGVKYRGSIPIVVVQKHSDFDWFKWKPLVIGVWNSYTPQVNTSTHKTHSYRLNLLGRRSCAHHMVTLYSISSSKNIKWRAGFGLPETRLSLLTMLPREVWEPISIAPPG